MQQDLAELTIFGIDGLFGQLTSRIYSTLTHAGRCTVQDITRRTGLNNRQVESTLVVLIQHHFALHYTDSRTGRTYFEANGETAYNIVFRYGKLAKIVEDRLGSDAAELLMTVVLLGHGRVSDIVRELQRQPEEVDKNAKLHAEDQDDETVPNGATAVNSDIPLKPSFGSNSKIDSIPQVHNLLDSLLCAGFLKKVTEHQFMPDCDREEEARQVVLENSFPTGLKGNKEKAKCLNDVNDLKRSWRDMEHDHAQGPWKRLKMNGRHTNGVSEDLGTAQLDIVDDGVTIDATAVVQPNFEKCNFVLRNQQLVKLAHRYIGETTSKVFGALLTVLEDRMLRCYDPLNLDTEDASMDDPPPKDAFLISPRAILSCLDPEIDLDIGLSLVPATNGVNGHSSSRPIDVSDDSPSGPESESESDDEPVNGTRATTLSDTSDPRLSKIEAHLQILQSDPRHYVHRIGRKWTVPFRTITRTLIQHEIENTITARFGTIASRLVRILLKNYSTEEKTLASLAILKPKEVRDVTNTLLQAGLLETQEIPRDNNRATNRLTWLYVYNPSRARKRLLNDSYRAMARLLRRAEVEKAKIAPVIEKAERTDVVGKEDKYLNVAEKAALENWKDVEGRLLNLVDRIDELVACLRDFSPINDAFVGNRQQPVVAEA